MVAALNVLAALVVAGWLFGRQIGHCRRLLVAVLFAGVLVVLGITSRSTAGFEASARHPLYDDPSWPTSAAPTTRSS